MTKINKQITKTETNSTFSGVKLDSLLDASPFEMKRNLGGKLTPSIFFDNLFEESQKNKELTDKIIGYLTGSIDLVTILGFSGIGKTTFSRNFISKNSDKFLFALIDCDLYANQEGLSDFNQTHIDTLNHLIEIARSEEEKLKLMELMNTIVKTKTKQDIENAIATILQKYLRSICSIDFEYSEGRIRRSEDILTMFLYFLKKKNLILSPYFSELFNENLKNLFDKIDSRDESAPSFRDWEKLIKKIKINDGFLILFLVIEYFTGSNEFENNESAKLEMFNKVIIFDNLDILPTELLHDHFIPYLMSSLKNWEVVFQEIFGVKNYDYKCLVFLRDANSATINIHVQDHQNIRIENYIPERTFYKEVITKRIQFYKNLILQDVKKDIIETENDENENSQTDNAQTKSKELEKEIKIADTLQQFISDDYYSDVLVPAFNMDYRNMASNLTQPIREFLNDRNSQLFYDENGIIKEKYKFGFRSIILNKTISWLGINKIFKFIPINKKEGYCLPARMILSLILNKSNLTDLNSEFSNQFLKAKRIKLLDILNETKDIYTINQVLETLTDLFLSHKRGYVYLVRFINRNVEDDWFKDISDSNATSKLKDDYLKITPSGIIFLKELITHYEFYSRISGNPGPLFLLGLEDDPTKGHSFVFENNIYRTLKVIKDHNQWMRNFLVNKFINKGLFPEDYLKSSFSYKFFGGHFEDEGVFQITRIVASQVEYINHYRLFVLDQITNQTTLQSANRAFVRIFKQYSDLFNIWDKDKKMVPYKNIITDFTNEIEKSNYKLSDSEIKFDISDSSKNVV